MAAIISNIEAGKKKKGPLRRPTAKIAIALTQIKAIPERNRFPLRTIPKIPSTPIKPVDIKIIVVSSLATISSNATRSLSE